MDIETALKSSTGYVNMDGMIGYLPFSAAKYLVGTGKYVYQQVMPWGYVVKEIKENLKK